MPRCDYGVVTTSSGRLLYALQNNVAQGLHAAPSGLDLGDIANRTTRLTEGGIKHTPENIVDIRKASDGKIVFLETGNRAAGLKHIMTRHEQDFANVGINSDQIPDAVMTAATQGEIIGYQGRGHGRAIYDVVFNDTRHQIAVSISNNGFIVGADPQSRLPPYVKE